ncbi:MAG: PH domain-containing protein [Wenzhouxiangellaceae bacterium]|nr:PH domain-containing protein [Wenzhouxiangellaceae bacterium]
MNELPDDRFSNAQLPSASIPDYREVHFEAVDARFGRYAIVSTLVLFAPYLIAAIVARWFFAIPLFAGLLAIAGLLGLTLGVAGYRWVAGGFRGWALREHDLIARSGVLWRNITALPIVRIQHLETSHGPLERMFGLARLKLYTAGGVSADLVVIGLAREPAEQLREHLVEQIRVRESALSNADAENV